MADSSELPKTIEWFLDATKWIVSLATGSLLLGGSWVASAKPEAGLHKFVFVAGTLVMALCVVAGARALICFVRWANELEIDTLREQLQRKAEAQLEAARQAETQALERYWKLCVDAASHAAEAAVAIESVLKAAEGKAAEASRLRDRIEAELKAANGETQPAGQPATLASLRERLWGWVTPGTVDGWREQGSLAYTVLIYTFLIGVLLFMASAIAALGSKEKKDEPQFALAVVEPKAARAMPSQARIVGVVRDRRSEQACVLLQTLKDLRCVTWSPEEVARYFPPSAVPASTNSSP